MIGFMIVDDSLVVRKNIQKLVEKSSNKVVCQAKDGLDALKLYRENRNEIDVVTLDISMQGLNGLETLQKLLEINKSLIVFMITSHGEESMVMDTIDNGATGYILKPVTDEKIEQIVQKVKNEF